MNTFPGQIAKKAIAHPAPQPLDLCVKDVGILPGSLRGKVHERSPPLARALASMARPRRSESINCTYRTCLAPGLAGKCHSLGPKQMSMEVLGRVIMTFLRRDTQDRNFVIPATPGRRFCESCACSSPVSSVFTLKDGAPSQECMKNAGFHLQDKKEAQTSCEAARVRAKSMKLTLQKALAPPFLAFFCSRSHRCKRFRSSAWQQEAGARVWPSCHPALSLGFSLGPASPRGRQHF